MYKPHLNPTVVFGQWGRYVLPMSIHLLFSSGLLFGCNNYTTLVLSLYMREQTRGEVAVRHSSFRQSDSFWQYVFIFSVKCCLSRRTSNVHHARIDPHQYHRWRPTTGHQPLVANHCIITTTAWSPPTVSVTVTVTVTVTITVTDRRNRRKQHALVVIFMVIPAGLGLAFPFVGNGFNEAAQAILTVRNGRIALCGVGGRASVVLLKF